MYQQQAPNNLDRSGISLFDETLLEEEENGYLTNFNNEINAVERNFESLSGNITEFTEQVSIIEEFLKSQLSKFK